jgi:hypothetical protein
VKRNRADGWSPTAQVKSSPKGVGSMFGPNHKQDIITFSGQDFAGMTDKIAEWVTSSEGKKVKVISTSVGIDPDLNANERFHAFIIFMKE